MTVNATTDPNPPSGYAPFDLYPYNPNKAAAYVFVALFGVVAILHLAAMIPYRSWFPLPMVIGGCFEAGGYYLRTMSHDNVRKVAPFVAQNLLILAAPPFLAASVFMSPRRIADVLESKHFLTWPRLLPKLFILVDVVCLGTQTAGAVMSGSEDPNQASQGRTLIQVGLITQLIALLCFVVWLGCFHRRLRCSHFDSDLVRQLSWPRVFWGLYTICVLFIIRTVTRIIEYLEGPDGTMLSNEIYLYVLDALVMCVIAALLLGFHPGRLRFQARRGTFKQQRGERLSDDENRPMYEMDSGRRI